VEDSEKNRKHIIAGSQDVSHLGVTRTNDQVFNKITGQDYSL